MNLKNDEVFSRIAEIIESKFGVNVKQISHQWQKENLIGSKFRFTPRDLIYLFFEIEKEFNIRISQEDIIEGSFKNIDGIAKCIMCSSARS